MLITGSASSPSTVSGWSGLCDELKLRVLGNLRPKELLVWLRVSSADARLAQDDKLWRDALDAEGWDGKAAKRRIEDMLSARPAGAWTGTPLTALREPRLGGVSIGPSRSPERRTAPQHQRTHATAQDKRCTGVRAYHATLAATRDELVRLTCDMHILAYAFHGDGAWWFELSALVSEIDDLQDRFTDSLPMPSHSEILAQPWG